MAREEVQIVAARVAPVESHLPERRGARAVRMRMELAERPAHQDGAAASEQPLGHLVRPEDHAAGGVHHEDAGRGVIDRAPVGRLLLEELLLACLDEEVRDVEHPGLEFLPEEREQVGHPLRLAGVLASQVLGEVIDEPHLRRQEPRGRKPTDEAAAGVGAKEEVGLDVGRIRDVPGPSDDGGVLIRFDLRPVGLGDREHGPDVLEPGVEECAGAHLHEGCQGTPHVGAAGRDRPEARMPDVGLDSRQMTGERRIEGAVAHGPGA